MFTFLGKSVFKSFLKPNQRPHCLRCFGTRLPGIEDTKDGLTILKESLTSINFREGTSESTVQACPRQTDFLIIGGGLAGNAAAYFLMHRNPGSINCFIIERDKYYTQASSVLSVGGVRHQFSLPQNVQMSMFTTEFLRDIKLHLSVLDLEPPNVPFSNQGYLFLANETYADTLQKNVAMQKSFGAKVELYGKEQLGNKFPWINLEGVEAGSYGMYGEGWYDPWCLMAALKRKNLSLGVHYIDGEVIALHAHPDHAPVDPDEPIRLTSVDVKLPNGDIQPIKVNLVINCGGPFSSEIAKLAGIGTGKGLRSTPLPVEPRKRYVYVVHCADGPGLETPFLVDTSGVYFRREGVGGNYLCGMSPSEEDEPTVGNLDVDYEFFNDKVWPLMAHRVKKFECLKLKNAWAGYYDYNYFDNNPIIGNHPVISNMMFVTGFTGHGIQHILAASRGINELIFDKGFKTIDLTPFSFERVIKSQPIYEEGII